MMLDFRSDTVTRPTRAMREAMLHAEVGDDVYGDDPTVNALQEYACDLFETEAALYVCSGTMGNLLALLSHCNRGEAVMLGKEAHIWIHEAGGMGCIAGIIPFALDDFSGIPSVGEIASVFRPRGDLHVSPTTLLALENTHNSRGGIPIPLKKFQEVAACGHSLGMNVHLDGARLFNACAVYNVPASSYITEVDSIQCCLSKGLGAPMGSLLCGKKPFIENARFWRKRLGGAQRQAGIAAAAGLIALRDMRERLVEDHYNAALLADLLLEAGFDVEPVEHRTNMVFFRLPDKKAENHFSELCAQRGVLINGAEEGRFRMVTHYDVDQKAVTDAVKIMKELTA